MTSVDQRRSGTARIDLADLPIRGDLRGRTPYGAPQMRVPYMLNTNENPFPLPDKVLVSVSEAAGGAASHLNRYPDRDATALRADLATYLGHGLGVDEVWAANGSNEILQQLFQVFGGGGRTVLGFTPTYAMYSLLAMSTGSTFISASRGPDFELSAEHVASQIERHQPDVVVLCSPNNPTGTSLDISVIEAALAAAPGMVVVDEAYAEFAESTKVSALTLLPNSPRLVVSRTMSKAFGMAGLRLGYFAASPAVVDAVQLVRLTYHLSSLTQAVARAALAHSDVLLVNVETIKVQRDRMVRGLLDLGLSVADSDANFVLAGEFSDERAVWTALLDEGVLVRDVGLNGKLRITVGAEHEVTALLETLGTVLRKRPELLLRA